MQRMRTPQNVFDDVPPGLEYLSTLEQVLIYQVDTINLGIGNKYKIQNIFGQNIYIAYEESNFYLRKCLRTARPFRIYITASTGAEVILMNRPYRCGGCFPFCHQVLEVFAPEDEIAGFVVKEWTCCRPSFVIQDADRRAVLRVKGPYYFCWDGCCTRSRNVNFYVETLGGRRVGRIQKRWSGYVKESPTDADNFGITFPRNLDVRMKAVLLGACLLIDFLYYEK